MTKKKEEKPYFEVYLGYIAVDYDYDSEYSCEESGCDREGICRCGRITNVTIKPQEMRVNVDYISVFKGTHRKPVKYDFSEIELYCLSRLLSKYKAYDYQSWYCPIEGGYYGEEVGQPRLHKQDDLKEDVKKLIDLSDIEKIRFVLEKEYDYLLEQLKDTSEVSIVEVEVDTLRRNNEYFSRLKKQDQPFTDFCGPHNLPLGIIFEGRLIDGYHRTAKCKLQKAPYIELK